VVKTGPPVSMVWPWRHLREDRDRLIWIPPRRCREGASVAALVRHALAVGRNGVDRAGHRAGGSPLGLSPDRCFVGASGEHSQGWAAEGAAGDGRALSATPGPSDELGLEWLGVAVGGTTQALGGGCMRPHRC
jgi:hypothetical protein